VKVNNPRGAACAMSRIVLVLTAALAALAVAFAWSVAPAGASSSSGGVTIGGGGTDDGTGAPDIADAPTVDAPTADASKYVRLWVKISRRDKVWARATAECESGGDPDAIGGGGQYRGAFQFAMSTWQNAPKSPGGDPIDYPYKTQAVVAVALMKKDGTGHWPNCG
jgi:transglycosylase-like protein